MTNQDWKIAVEGAAIFAMPEENRYAVIIEPSPEYKADEGATNTEKNKIKLIANVRLFDGRQAEYYMNRTSARKIASILGTDLSYEGMKKWVGKKLIWGKIRDQVIGGNDKKVLYVTAVEDEIPVVKV